MGLFNKKELERIAELENIIKNLECELEDTKKIIDEMEKGIHEDTNNKIKENEEVLSKLYNIINERIEKSKMVNMNLEQINKQIEEKKIKLNDMDIDIKNKERNLKATETRIKNQKESLMKEKEEIKKELDNLKNEKENVAHVIESGTKNFNYHYEDSKHYELMLREIKEEQKEAVKNVYSNCDYMIKYETIYSKDFDVYKEPHDNLALSYLKAWRVDGNYGKGKIYMKNIAKLALRAFNNECDNIIMNLKYSTVTNSEVKIKKSYEVINEMLECHQCYITEYYLNLKKKELMVKVAYLTSKQLEKEEQQRIKEQMKEEERVRKEIEAEEKKVEKEEQHFMNEINKLQKRMAKENQEAQAILLKQIEELQSKLAEVSEVKADLKNR